MVHGHGYIIRWFQGWIVWVARTGKNSSHNGTDRPTTRQGSPELERPNLQPCNIQPATQCCSGGVPLEALFLQSFTADSMEVEEDFTTPQENRRVILDDGRRMSCFFFPDV